MSAIWGVVSLSGPLTEEEKRPLGGAFSSRPFSGCFFPKAALFREGINTTVGDAAGLPKVGIVSDARLDARENLAARLGVGLPPDCIDDALILRSWRKWGAGFAGHLFGDYALAVWDDERAELLCARDHIGARPLYYSETPERLCFASHIRTLLAMPGVSRDLDEEFISGILHNQYDASAPTYFKSIRKLPPAHLLIAGSKGVRLERHWDPWRSRDVRFKRDSEYVEAARDLLDRAVCDRLRDVERAGVHLSGGLDSSSVTVLAAQELRKKGKRPPEAFSWQPAWDGLAPPAWEHAFIEAVSAMAAVPVHYCESSAEDMLEVMREDPARDPVTQAQFLEITVQKKAMSLGVETILTGWGGDEGLSYYGRGYYADLFFRGRWAQAFRDAGHRSKHPLRLVASEVLSVVHPDASDVVSALLKGSGYKKGWNNFVHPAFSRRVAPPLLKNWHEWSIRSRMASAWASGVHAERMESWYCHGARRGIVYAYPLLDRRVLEFAAGLPREQFVRGPWTRWLMRNSVEGILPRELCWHRDKDEPVRFPATVKTVQYVMEKIGEGLNSAPKLPARSKYIDMPNLLARLRPEAVNNDPRAGGLLRTVQFLELDDVEVKL